MLFLSFTENHREQQFMFAMTFNISRTPIVKSLSTYNSQYPSVLTIKVGVQGPF